MRAPDVEWTVIVPVKELGVAKSRLRDLEHPPGVSREDIALAMAGDVVAAARRTPGVTGVVVITNDVRAAELATELGALVVADVADAGLNPALEDGARAAQGWYPRTGVAAVSSDLAALRPDELGAALAAATAHARSLVADVRGDGTTVLMARPGVALDPRYGRHSRHEHVTRGVVQLEAAAWPSLRLDVDTPADLAAARELGVGPRLLALLGPE